MSFPIRSFGPGTFSLINPIMPRSALPWRTPGDQTLSATFEFVAEDGTTVLGTFQVTLGPHAQIARFVREMFPAVPAGIGFIRITTSSPVCSMALRMRGLDLSQLPIFINPQLGS